MRRKNWLTVMFTAALMMIYGQTFAQVERNLVVFEIGTGTWCYNCQGAAWGAEDMLEMGHNIAVIEYHFDDEYANEESLYRIGPEFYDVSGYPTTYFDGTDSHIGGNAMESIYETYVPFYYDQADDLCPFSLAMECSYTDGNYQIIANMEQHIPIENDVVLHCVVTESNIPEVWYDSDELDFVARKMIPDQNGTQLDFSTGNTQTISLEFEESSEWVHENIEVVIFIQDVETKEIYQAEKHSFWEPEHELELNLTKIIDPGLSTCSNAITPRILLKNDGASDINSIKIEYSINGESHNLDWVGLIRSERGTEFNLPVTPFIPSPNNNIEITILEVNGSSDFHSECLSMSKQFITPLEIDCSTIYIEVKTDGYYGSYSFDIFNGDGEVVYHRDSYSAAYTIFYDTVHLQMEECYTFAIYDSYGDGLCPGGGGDYDGYYLLKDANEEIFAEGCEIGYEEHVLFLQTDPNVRVNNQANADIRIFPNPVEGSFFIESSNKNPIQSLEIFNLSGQIVKTFNTATGDVLMYDINELKQGIYLLRIMQSDKVYLEQIIMK